MPIYEKDEILVFKDFLITVKNMVKEAMGEQFNVDICHVTKNNSIELDGIIILRKNETVTPNIYLNTYYDRYLEGEKLIEIMEEIIEIYQATMDEGEKEAATISYNFDEMKECIIYHLINYKKNHRLLKEVPYIRFMDLAVTFHCLVKNNKEGLGTIRITNEHLVNWGVDIKEITELANINTPNILPSVLRTMNEVIVDIFNKDKNELKGKEELKNYTEEAASVEEEFLKEMLNNTKEGKPEDMYVLTNTKGINGATCLLYPNSIKEMAERFNSNFYILPSSIHEIILIMDNEQLDKQLLHDMVVEVNRTQVPEEEILSDNIYYYSQELDSISM